MPRDEHDALKDEAKVLAMFVRDGLEDLHHQGDLPQELMPALNKRIRDALYTALYTMERAHEDWRCDMMVDRKRRGIPKYWEEPQLWEPVANPKEFDEEATRYYKRQHAEKYGLPIDE